MVSWSLVLDLFKNEKKKGSGSGFDQNCKVVCHVHHFNTTCTLKTSRSLVSQLITMSDFSLKPGTLFGTPTLETITSYFQKPTKVSRDNELPGHARKLRVTLRFFKFRMTTN